MKGLHGRWRRGHGSDVEEDAFDVLIGGGAMEGGLDLVQTQRHLRLKRIQIQGRSILATLHNRLVQLDAQHGVRLDVQIRPRGLRLLEQTR